MRITVRITVQPPTGNHPDQVLLRFHPGRDRVCLQMDEWLHFAGGSQSPGMNAIRAGKPVTLECEIAQEEP